MANSQAELITVATEVDNGSFVLVNLDDENTQEDTQILVTALPSASPPVDPVPLVPPQNESPPDPKATQIMADISVVTAVIKPPSVTEKHITTRTKKISENDDDEEEESTQTKMIIDSTPVKTFTATSIFSSNYPIINTPITNLTTSTNSNNNDNNDITNSNNTSISATINNQISPLKGKVPDKPIKLWTAQEVASWLESLGLAQYSDAFLENEISGEVLMYLNAHDITDLGIKKIGHRKMIELEIKKLTNSTGASSSSSGSKTMTNAITTTTTSNKPTNMSNISSTTTTTTTTPIASSSSLPVTRSPQKEIVDTQMANLESIDADEETKNLIQQILAEEEKQRKLSEEKNDRLVEEMLLQEENNKTTEKKIIH